MKTIAFAGARAPFAVGLLVAALAAGCGKLEGPGEIRGSAPVPAAERETRDRQVRDANAEAS